jgi:hypothetical protein
MRITIDIDDATGAVTITPGTNAPDTSAAEERRMAAIRSFVCAPAPSSPLSPDTDLPVADYSVMAFLAGVPWWDMAEPGGPEAQEPDAVECGADGITREFRDATGRMYRWYDAERQLNIYDDNGRGLRTIKGIDVNAVTTGPDRFGIRYRVGLPAEVGRPTCFVGYDEAVAFVEWLESVGGPKFQHDEPEPELEPEPVLDTGSDPDPRDMKMPYCRYPRDREAGRYATETQHGVIESESGYYEWAESGVCACDWDPRNRALTIRWANGILDQCYRVHPDSAQLRVHQVSEGGKWSAWWPTTEGAKRAVFDTEEQAQTFVARLAEAFEKGKA